MILKILGTGCPKCKLLEDNVRKAVLEVGGNQQVEKVTGLDEIMGYGVMMTPALVVDEKVISVGKVLKPDEIKKLF